MITTITHNFPYSIRIGDILFYLKSGCSWLSEVEKNRIVSMLEGPDFEMHDLAIDLLFELKKNDKRKSKK